MEVAPNSPMARAKDNTTPARIPWRQQGMRMRQNIYVSERPRVHPAWARVSSKLSKAPRAVRYISGNTTADTAKIADHHCITSFWEKVS